VQLDGIKFAQYDYFKNFENILCTQVYLSQCSVTSFLNIESNLPSLRLSKQTWTGYRSRYSNSLRAERSGDRNPVGERFSATVQTGPGLYPVFYKMGTGSFPGVKRLERGVDRTLPSGAEVKERVELYLYPSPPPMGFRGLFQGERYLYRNLSRECLPASSKEPTESSVFHRVPLWFYCNQPLCQTTSSHIL